MKATKGIKTVVVQETKEVPVITLELNEQEAQVLRMITASIAGPSAGPRGVADRLYRTLGDAGFTGYSRSDYGVNVSGTITLNPSEDWDYEAARQAKDEFNKSLY